MSETLTIMYNYRIEGHFIVSGDDVGFYRSLPEAKERHMNSKSGKPEIPRKNIEQLLTVFGSAVLSSTVIAAAIKSWLEYKRTKITISVEGAKKSLTFEGPNLNKSQPEITQLIDALLDESESKALRVRAEHIEQEQKDA